MYQSWVLLHQLLLQRRHRLKRLSLPHLGLDRHRSPLLRGHGHHHHDRQR